MITQRYRKLTNGNYRIYFDYYNPEATPPRKTKFTKLVVSKDFSKQTRGKTPEDAIALDKATGKLNEWRNELRIGVDVSKLKVKALEYLEVFLRKQPQTEPVISNLRGALKQYLYDRIGEEDILLSKVNTEAFGIDFCQWMATKNKEGKLNRHPKTQRQIVTTIRRVLKSAIIEKQIAPGNQIAIREAFKAQSKLLEDEIKYYTKEEVLKLKKLAGNNHTRLGFLFSVATGQRLSDVKNAKWDDIGEEILKKEIGNEVVERSITVLNYTPIKTRRMNKKVTVQLKELANWVLDKMQEMRNGETIFWDITQSRSSISLEMRRWAKQAELENEHTFHAGRHTFAVLSLQAGMSIYAIQKLLAHSDITTTQRYAKFLNKTALEEMDDKFPEL